MSLLTAEEVTNLYLYGSKIKPANIENENLIRDNPLEIPTTTSVDINEYMTTGPGRFASPAFFEVIKQFFSPTSSGLVPGIYTKQDLYDRFGLNTYDDKTVTIQQSLYDDGHDNYLERAYIWETTAFKIDDRTTFVIEADGSRYIKDFGVIPFSNPGELPKEDFDFKSDSGFSKLVNSVLEPIVDPSGIGRTVDIYFDGTRNLQGTFTYTDYVNAVSTAALPNPLLAGAIIANAFSFTQQLFDSGSIRFLDGDNKPILYGSDKDDIIFGTQSRTHVDIADITNPLRGWVQYGIHYIGGAGNDKLVGTDHDDKLDGGDGNDLLDGLGGNDTLIGGEGNDRLLGEDGNDTYLLQTAGGVDTVLDHSGGDQIQIDGAAVSGEFRPAFDRGQIYYSADNAYELRPMLGDTWRVSARDAGTGEYKAVADIGGWLSGEFGITSNMLGTEEFPDLGRVALSLPASTHYTHMDGSLSPDKGVQFDGGSKSDSFYGSSHSDVISTGGGSSNYVVNANGGDDKAQGGDSRDFIRTGDNFPSSTAPVSDNDLAFGGAQSDVLLGGYGSDQLWGDADDGGWLATGADSGGRGDWLGGEGGNDSLHGSRSSDVAFGGAGEDLLEGGAGGDLLLGDAQYSPYSGAAALSYVASLTDSYRWSLATGGMVKLPAASYSSAPVKVASANAFSWVWSAAGDDYTLSTPAGFSFDDRLAPDGGGDVLDGGLGDDWMAGQAGGDTLDGGGGDDILYGDDVDGLMAAADQGGDTLTGGAGNDRLFGGGGDDSLTGGPGDDAVSGGVGKDTYLFNQGDGHDTVVDPDKDSVLLFGPGISRDNITLKLGSLALVLGNGDEVHIQGFDPNDAFNSSSVGVFGFADGTSLTLDGLLARGFDLAGTAAADQLAGTNTVDRIQGLAGNDALAGGGGDDTLDGGSGNDTLDGGAGADTADYGTASASVRVNLGLATPQKTYGSGYDTMASIENLTGSNFNDFLVGNKAGNVLAGGLGADSLSGKSGADRFVLTRLEDSGLAPSTSDTIGDFKAGEGDKIDLSQLDADSATAGRQAFNGVILSAFDTANATGQLVFDAGQSHQAGTCIPSSFSI